MTKSKYEKVDLVANPSQVELGTIEEILITNDLSKLTASQRLDLLQRLCETHKFNPLSRPFDYLDLNGKLVLYINKSGVDQLRKNHNISITKLEKIREDNIIYVTAHAQDSTGRSDIATGAVSLLRTEPKYRWENGQRIIDEEIGTPLKGNDLINAQLKAETKAKRRVTLSMGGYGGLSEDDIELIEPDTSKPSLETLNKVHEESMKIVEEAQEYGQGLYKIDDNFLSHTEITFVIKNKVNDIFSLETLEQYNQWMEANKDGIKAFAKDHKAEYMELYELKQKKQEELKGK